MKPELAVTRRFVQTASYLSKEERVTDDTLDKVSFIVHLMGRSHFRCFLWCYMSSRGHQMETLVTIHVTTSQT